MEIGKLIDQEDSLRRFGLLVEAQPGWQHAGEHRSPLVQPMERSGSLGNKA